MLSTKKKIPRFPELHMVLKKTKQPKHNKEHKS